MVILEVRGGRVVPGGGPVASQPRGVSRWAHHLRLSLTMNTARLQFLSNLSPIDAFEPLPPARSVVSGEELAVWWREHDAIETEVHEFDYGDMAKMKALAMGKPPPALALNRSRYCVTQNLMSDRAPS